MSKQQWVEPVRFVWKGHKFFFQDGGVCVADDSGDTPDQTEDGPLWVDGTRPAIVGMQKSGLAVSLPVTKPGDLDGEYYVGVTVQCLRGLVGFMSLQVVFRVAVQSMFDALRDIDMLRARTVQHSPQRPALPASTPPAVERAAPAAPPAPDSKPVWLSKRLAMEVLGVSGQTLYDWRRKGRIKYVFNKATRTYEYEVSTAPKRYSRK